MQTDTQFFTDPVGFRSLNPSIALLLLAPVYKQIQLIHEHKYSFLDSLKYRNVAQF